jgi:hypothetical protein
MSRVGLDALQPEPIAGYRHRFRIEAWAQDDLDPLRIRIFSGDIQGYDRLTFPYAIGAHWAAGIVELDPADAQPIDGDILIERQPDQLAIDSGPRGCPIPTVGERRPELETESHGAEYRTKPAAAHRVSRCRRMQGIAHYPNRAPSYSIRFCHQAFWGILPIYKIGLCQANAYISLFQPTRAKFAVSNELQS